MEAIHLDDATAAQASSPGKTCTARSCDWAVRALTGDRPDPCCRCHPVRCTSTKRQEILVRQNAAFRLAGGARCVEQCCFCRAVRCRVTASSAPSPRSLSARTSHDAGLPSSSVKRATYSGSETMSRQSLCATMCRISSSLAEEFNGTILTPSAFNASR